jgi:hypothetical protein
VSALAEQHETWAGARERLWNAAPPAPKPSKKYAAVSPFVRARRAAEANRLEKQREAFDRQMIRFRAGFTDPALDAPAEDWPAYTPPVTYDSYVPPKSTPGRKTMREIIKETAIKHHVTVNDILSIRRDRSIVAARQESMWRCKMETTNSLPAIGRAHGGRDHTTVIHSVRRQEERMAAATGVNEPLRREANAGVSEHGATV